MAELKRYEQKLHSMDESPTGEWVRFADVESLLPKWIKCSERLPELGSDVIVCTKSGCVGEAIRREVWEWLSGREIDDSPVIAWTPLPAPLEEKE